MHILVQDAGMVREQLNQAGIECGGEREVEVVSIVDQPARWAVTCARSPMRA